MNRNRICANAGRWLCRMALLALAFTAPGIAVAQEAPAAATAATSPTFVLEPYLQNFGTDTMSVLWMTSEPAYGWVEYGETEALGQRADWVVDGMRHANTTIHKVPIKGLKPGTTYHYRVGFQAITHFGAYRVDFKDTVYSSIQSFQTLHPDQPEARLLVVNDLHNNYPTFERLLTIIRDLPRHAIFFNGDCFNDPARQEDVVTALRIYNTGVSAASTPCYYIRGNHEIRGAYARHFKQHFDYPEGEFYFAQTIGPVRVIALDCGEDKDDSSSEYSGLNDFSGYRRDQAEWLKREIASEAFQQATYRVLIHHIPLYGSGASRFSRELWEDVLNTAPIDLSISGHTHRMALTPAGEAGNPYPTVVGGAHQNGTGTVIALHANAERCHVQIIREDGSVFAEVTVTPSGR